MKIINDEEIFGIEDIIYEEEPNCEHCGDLEPFTAMVETDPTYCLDCFDDIELSEDDKVEINLLETQKKIEYFSKRLVRLCNYRDELLEDKE